MESIMNYFNEMDFQSQKQLSVAYKVLILITAVISFAIGYQQQKFSICAYSILAQTLFCCIVMGPAWPCWKRNSLKFKKNPLIQKKNQ